MREAPLLALRPGVEVVPVWELSEELQQQLQGHGDDFAVSARYTRQTTSLVDAASAELLAEFREPSSIDQAVRRFAAQREVKPAAVLEQAWSVLESLLRRGVLLRVDDPRMKAPPALVAGDLIGDWTIIRPLRELEDTQIYVVRGPGGQLGVVKMRPGAEASDKASIDGEAEILRDLEGDLAPLLLEVSSFEDRPYLVSEWCPGISVEEAASRWRVGHGSGGDRRALLRLTQGIARAYGRLHGQGVLHGDVHPQNILLDRCERLWLLDFTLSSRIVDGPVELGSGISFYRAPELASSLLAGEPPLADVRSEQFSVGALIYRLLTGHHYRDFDLEQEAQLRQTAEAGMRPFRHRGLPDWPDVEGALEKALDAQPEKRFEELQDFARALDEARPSQPQTGRPVSKPALGAAKKRLLSSLAPGGAWWRDGLRSPTASVQNGAGGLAFAAYRGALLEEDAEKLALGDLWIRRARQEIAAPEAFTAPDLELTANRVGLGSPQHTESGVHAVEGLIAHALGQRQRQEASVLRFLETIDRPFHGLDLTLGTASPLVVGAGLLETLDPCPAREELCGAGERILGHLWKALGKEPALRSSSLGNLGLAHGWAGFLFATLRWRQAAPGPWPKGLRNRLEQWAETAEPHGRGRRWPRHLGTAGSGNQSMPGWCNGTTGHLLLACLVARRIKPSLRGLAEEAAYDVWDAGSPSASLCCGLVGRAYGLLALFRLTGEKVWRQRAQALAETAASVGSFDEAPPYSLFKGELSLALLACDIEHAEASSFPFLEGSGFGST